MAKLTANFKLNEEQLTGLKQIVPEAFRSTRTLTYPICRQILLN